MTCPITCFMVHLPGAYENSDARRSPNDLKNRVVSSNWELRAYKRSSAATRSTYTFAYGGYSEGSGRPESLRIPACGIPSPMTVVQGRTRHSRTRPFKTYGSDLANASAAP